MFKSEAHRQIKALIGRLEDEAARLEEETMTSEEADKLGVQIELCWKILCRRESRRGPYVRRQTEAA